MIKNNMFRLPVLLVALSVLMFGYSYAASPQIQSCNVNAASSFYVVGANWGNYTSPISATAGQSNIPLTIRMYNENGCTLVGAMAKMPLVSNFTNANGSINYATDYLGTIQPYSFFTIVYNLDIANNTPIGPNDGVNEQVDLSWYYANTSSSTSGIYTASVFIPTKGSSRLQFNVSNHMLAAGAENNITLEVKNSGTGYEYDIVPYVTSSSTVNPVGAANEIASLAPNATGKISIPVYISPGAASEAVPVSMTINYVNPYGYNESEPITVAMYAAPYSGNLSLVPASQYIEEGIAQNISMYIYNNGYTPITNMTVQLSPQSPLNIIGGDGYFAIAYIPPHGKVALPLDLYVASSSSTVATLSASLSYIASGQAESSTRSISFLTPGYINITNTGITLLPAAPMPGSIFSMTGTLLNSGTSPASAVTITASAPRGISILGGNSTFIGTLSEGSPTSFTISFEASPTAKPGSYTVPLNISYINNINQKQSVEITVPITLSKPNSSLVTGVPTGTPGKYPYARHSGAGVLIDIIIAIIVIVVAVSLVYKHISKRKNAKRGAKQQK
ncbi:MAG: hypothetical protein LVQ97_04370 [Candidatus Micrarchaeales archaeon]|uniref:Uncharacterized protein n=1 Tax=Candidatus Micrarchaeum acidiphilum ARMAN-2 TaxID=425595 RepID=C7DH51_MICA2|nr:MAG: hypothetical protein UNLARM2_0397 [Candidatus Micrarchaeum acidiphilum ARMAN-2]MCW6161391.1 hypothetical protein [Candidatus Micrarchaeales archaeon]